MRWLDKRIDGFIRRIRDDPERDKNKIFIGNPGEPTYWRWFVLPRNRVFNVYLHNFLKDDDHDLHDHRASNITIILQGWYYEERFVYPPQAGQPLPPTYRRRVRRLVPFFRLPETPHRVVLRRDTDGEPVPCWSLFIKLPDVRDWGFWCPGVGKVSAKWKPWQEYAATRDASAGIYGIKGKGCDE